jgi:RibD C-terminal domain
MTSPARSGHSIDTANAKRRIEMGRIVVTEFVSLDGVMEDPGGVEGFEYGGWTFEIARGEEGDRFKLEETLASEALLLGRVTYEGDLAGEVAKIKQAHDGDVVVHGSARLAQALLEHDLVDELRLMVYPVVLGSGKRLFGDTSDRKALQLVDSKTVGDGVTILTYGPA